MHRNQTTDTVAQVEYHQHIYSI